MSTVSVPHYRLSVDQYHRLINSGALTPNDRVELLDGWLVEKMPQKPAHAVTIETARRVLDARIPSNWHIREQKPITTSRSEPEPDLAVVRGKPHRYSKNHPTLKDIGTLIEISDTTLVYDRTFKYRIYAQERIPFYWIINLVDSQIEVYSKPKSNKTATYAEHRIYRMKDSVPVVLGGKDVARIPVRKLIC